MKKILPDQRGYFAEFGGKYVPETLMPALSELEIAYQEARGDEDFQRDLQYYFENYIGRPSLLYYAKRLTEELGGAKIYLKREDLNHTGAHKINHTLGEALLAKYMGKSKIMSETGAGQHGVALATAAAIVGLKGTTTGDTLSDIEYPIILEKIEFPEPVISIAVEPKTKADQEKMGLALKKLAEEDPTFKVKGDAETGQTIISGMGELHLEILVDRMSREFSVGANIGKPQVAYRETIKTVSKAEGKYIRQTGGHGQYGHVWIEIEPQERSKGFEFINRIKGGIIPQEYIPAIEKGIKEAMDKGVIAGYPLVDIKATLYDGSFHDVDSSESAFKIAGSIALQEAVKHANPILLEPIMKIQVVTPEKFMGDVIGDLNSKRGRIEKMEDRGVGINLVKAIDAQVPLSGMFGYATQLRSMSQGRGTSTMEFSHYAEVPKNVAEEIIGNKTK